MKMCMLKIKIKLQAPSGEAPSPKLQAPSKESSKRQATSFKHAERATICRIDTRSSGATLCHIDTRATNHGSF